jgi:8-oxo-dGTP pyrophosphatase MutT (NUDIX family)
MTGVKKIEYSYGAGIKMSDMASTTYHTNMPFVEGDSYESESDYGEYSDADFSDEELGDRCDDDYKQTENDKQSDELEQADDERAYKESLIQNPDDMKYIRPARVMPSIMEMNACFDNIIDVENYAKARAWAVPIIEYWFRCHLNSKKDKRIRHVLDNKRKELALWKNARTCTRGIRQLGTLVIFDDEYNHMVDSKNRNSLIKLGIESRVQTIAAKAQAVIDTEKAKIRGRKAGKARALAKEGMNKKTAWHKARNANALLLPDNSVSFSAEGKGKRAQRKIRQAKDLADAIALAIRLPELKKVPFVFVDTSDERTDEQKATDKGEENEDLYRMSRICVEKIDLLEAEEKKQKADAEEKAEEKAELEEFVTVMTRNKKPKKITIEIGFTGLKDRIVEERKATDKKFAARCDGFEVLGSKEKLAEVLKFTSLCRSVGTKKKCYHKDCRFAHSIEELQQKDCRFGMGCRFVRQIASGQYENTSFGRTGKTCSCMHTGEHKRGFCKRMGLKYEEEKVVEKVVVEKVVEELSWLDRMFPEISDSEVEESPCNEKTSPETNDLKVDKCKPNMTKAWNAVVVDTLTEDEKSTIYGKGFTILGTVSEERESIPIIPVMSRKPWDKSGLGFFEETQKTTTKLLVSAPGFNWVKGEVLQPPPSLESPSTEKKQICDIMTKVTTAVEKINKKVAKIEKDDIDSRVDKAITKAAEITQRLMTEKTLEKVTKVEGSKQTEPVTILRVPKADAELALIGAIRNGLTNFRIEYIDPICKSSAFNERRKERSERRANQKKADQKKDDQKKDDQKKADQKKADQKKADHSTQKWPSCKRAYKSIPKVFDPSIDWPEGYIEKDGAGFIIHSADSNRVLLVQDSDKRSSKWGFPKGHRELCDSNPLECAKRETLEETGLVYGIHYKSSGDQFKLSRGRSYIYQNAFMYGDESKVVITCQEDEVSSVKWFDIASLKKRNTDGWANSHLRRWLKPNMA